ncbi:MAG: amidohydrolase family protein [Bryobacterales bacterium]|nr:amidohydrolase family protein [Bryobacterales bacterium]
MRRAAACFLFLAAGVAAGQTYDLVLRGGRVMDPESGLDAVRDVGISGGVIRAVSPGRLEGKTVADVSGLVVAPGFIDLHRHGQDPLTYRLQALDGVTSGLELEIGTDDVAGWYAAREGKTLVNFGTSVGHPPIRRAVTGDTGRREATPEEIAEIGRRLDEGLRLGAPTAGFGLAYTPAASRLEIMEMYRIVARHGAVGHVHMRSAAGGGSPVEALQEMIAVAAVTGASVQVVHINSTALKYTREMLEMIEGARARGLDITTEAYPYTAGSTSIQAALFDTWIDKPESEYRKLMWTATGERLTRETFLKYRKTGGRVIVFTNTEDMVDAAIEHPLTMIASDGVGYQDGTGHPRSAGCYARILGHYVRGKKSLTLMEALRKMTLAPARRLEHRVPGMRDKGRIRPGADADITIFDAATVIDRSTYEKPAEPSAGIRHVLVNGTFVVRDARIVDGAAPGRPIRAPILTR